MMIKAKQTVRKPSDNVARFPVEVNYSESLQLGQMVWHQINNCVYLVREIEPAFRRVVLTNLVSRERFGDFWGNVVPCSLSRKSGNPFYLASTKGG